jgi:hypothetical protein
MIALLRAWGGALFVLIVGIMITVRLSPRVAPGTSIPLSDQVFRLHLPWLVICAVMVAVAGALHWRPSTPQRRLLATLPVPVLAVVGGTAAGASGAVSAVAALLYLGEGVLGVAAGLLVVVLVTRRDETAAYPYPG